MIKYGESLVGCAMKGYVVSNKIYKKLLICTDKNSDLAKN